MATQWQDTETTAKIWPAHPRPRPHGKRGVPHHLGKDTPAEHTAAYLIEHGGTGDTDPATPGHAG